MLRWLTAVGAAMTMAFPAEGQECRATLQSQPPAWSALQTREQPDTAQMKLFIETTCRDCDPMIVVEVFAGAASVSFRSMPIAQKTGTEFAEAVVRSSGAIGLPGHHTRHRAAIVARLCDGRSD